MTPAPVRILGRPHEAVSLSIRSGRWAVHLLDLAVFGVRAEPIFQVPVKFAARNAALATVHLALYPQALQVVLSGAAVGVRVNKRSGTPPCPFDVVGAGIPARQRDSAILTAVDVIQLGVCKAETCAIDGVEEVKDGVVKLGRKVDKGEASRRARLVRRLWLLVRDRVRAARRRQLRALGHLDGLLLYGLLRRRAWRDGRMFRDAIDGRRHRSVEVMRSVILSLIFRQGPPPPRRPLHASLHRQLSGSLIMLLPRHDHVFRSAAARLEHGITALREGRDCMYLDHCYLVQICP